MPEKSFFHDFPGGHFSKKKLEKLLIFFLWGDGLGPGGVRARAPGPRGLGLRAQRASRAQSIAELYIFSRFAYHVSTLKKTCMKMVDKRGWILEFRAESDTK